LKVLDASAVLAVIYQEPGAAAALAAFQGGLLSSVNAAEIMSKVARDGAPPEATLSRLSRFGLTIVPATEDHALRAAALHELPGMSLGDRFCMALAQERGLPVVTADRAWALVRLGATVELIR
jgi:PIN domain nuclease of toxin-antitoxin system